MPDLDFLRLYFCFVAFLLGISIGSFLNVLIYRLPLGLNPAKGRSFCPRCNTNLRARDLVPLFSYLFLKGRCRYCHEPISIRYFIVELLTGLVFTLTVYLFGPGPTAFSHIIVFCLLIVIAYIDYDRLYIPNYLTLSVLLVQLIRMLYLEGEEPRFLLITALIPPALLLITSLISKLLSRGGFGFGDIKLALALGAGVYLGTFSYYMILTFLTQFFILLLATLANKSLSKQIAYAPGLVMTYIIYMLTQGFLC